MKRLVIITVMLVASALSGCALFNPDTVMLNSTEKQEAMAIADTEHALQVRRVQADAEYAKVINRIGEEGNALNLRRENLCYSVKKNHHLDFNKQYRLDTVRGELVKF